MTSFRQEKTAVRNPAATGRLPFKYRGQWRPRRQDPRLTTGGDLPPSCPALQISRWQASCRGPDPSCRMISHGSRSHCGSRSSTSRAQLHVTQPLAQRPCLLTSRAAREAHGFCHSVDRALTSPMCFCCNMGRSSHLKHEFDSRLKVITWHTHEVIGNAYKLIVFPYNQYRAVQQHNRPIPASTPLDGRERLARVRQKGD